MPPPVALLAIAFATGIALEEGLGAGVGLAMRTAVALVCVAFAVGALALALARRGGVGIAAMVHAAALGSLAAAAAWPVAPMGLFGGGSAVVSARVLEPPERNASGTRVLVEVGALQHEGEPRERATMARALVHLPGAPTETLLPGDLVRSRAQLKAPHGFAEPDAPDPSRRAAERGVVAVAGLASPASMARIDGAERPSLLRSVAELRARLVAVVAAQLDGDRRALVESLVLGERGDVRPALDDAFRLAGVSHVLSVSGLHLAIAAYLFYVGLRRALVYVRPIARRVAVQRVAALAALPATALYTVLTGAAVATVRACVVAWVFLVGAALLRRPSSPAALGVAALGILGASPLALYDPSLQLSFAAAIGTVLLLPRLRVPALDGDGALRWLARAVAGLVATSAAALAATTPIAAWHFAQTSPAGLIANVIVVPLAELGVLPTGLVGCVLASVAPRAGAPLLWLSGLGAAAMARVVLAIAALPGVAAASRVPPPTLLEAAAWYGALVALGVAGRRGLRVALGCAVVCAVSLGGRAAAPRLWPSLRVTFLDVGQGDAALVELPDGTTLLVDGGGSFDPGFDPGAQVLVPWLARHGTRRLDVVVLTHPHPDHANGLASVVAALPVGEVWTNGVASTLPGLVRLEAVAAARGVAVTRPRPFRRGDVEVEVLHPLVDGAVRVPPGWSENDGSIVLRIRFGAQAVLLAGDAERRAERRLVDGAAGLRADVVKAPHHGSRTSSTPAFVAAARPAVVVFSVGADNRWHFPSPLVDARWRQAGARTLRTDLDGAVSVRLDGKRGIEVRCARARAPP